MLLCPSRSPRVAIRTVSRPLCESEGIRGHTWTVLKETQRLLVVLKATHKDLETVLKAIPGVHNAKAEE